MKRMKTHFSIIILLLALVCNTTFAQKQKNQVKELAQTNVALKAENWEFKPQTVEFLEYKNRPAMKILTSFDRVILKDYNFSNGTIEYDMEPVDPRFTSCYFRWKDSKECECFYFRTGCADKPQAIDAIQYAPYIDGVNLWDLMFHFQTNADFKKNEWNHVKLVVSGKQMRVYVNDLNTPVLEVPMLEGNSSSGTLVFDGQVVISNLVVKADVEGLNPEPGIDPTANDPRYIRKWKVSQPLTTEKGIDFRDEYKPNAETIWEDITAERRGLINLNRKFGKAEGRRIVWLKTTIYSEKAQDKVLNFGFSDEVWVTINNSPLYIDKNLYYTPMAKQPDGRLSIENSSITIPLKEGENQLMIGVANFFYGWGIVARFNNLEGIKLEQ
jgi:hypothetical protein